MPISDTMKRIMDIGFNNIENPSPIIPGNSIYNQGQNQSDLVKKDKEDKR